MCSSSVNEIFHGGEAKATMLTYIGQDDSGAEPGVDSINAYL